MIRLLLVFVSILGTYAFAYTAPLHPNPEITVGDLCTPQDREFEGYRYKEKVPTCYRDVSDGRKRRIYEAYQVPAGCRGQYTIDHYVPLSMGGSNRPQNLWPEHKDVKATRQNMEQELYGQLKNGLITQHQALTMLLDAKMNPPRVKPTKCSTK